MYLHTNLCYLLALTCFLHAYVVSKYQAKHIVDVLTYKSVRSKICNPCFLLRIKGKYSTYGHVKDLFAYMPLQSNPVGVGQV